MDEFDRQDINTAVGDDNSNDENDVDDETMSGKTTENIFENLHFFKF